MSKFDTQITTGRYRKTMNDGKAWISIARHNFGGKIHAYGDLRIVNHKDEITAVNLSTEMLREIADSMSPEYIHLAEEEARKALEVQETNLREFDMHEGSMRAYIKCAKISTSFGLDTRLDRSEQETEEDRIWEEQRDAHEARGNMAMAALNRRKKRKPAKKEGAVGEQ